MFRRLTQFVSAALLAIILCTAWGATAQAQYTITILRGVEANTNNGNASKGPGQFAFTAKPPVVLQTLSLFDTTANAAAALVIKPCYLHVVVTMPNNPPIAGDQGMIRANGHPYNVVFDNVPTGHWSIELGGYLQAVARADFSAYAYANPNYTNGFGLAQGVNCL